MQAMAQPGTFYILGAGASAGLVPFTATARNLIRRLYMSIGIYSVNLDAWGSPLYNRMARFSGKGPYLQSDMLLRYIPRTALELAVQKVLAPRLGHQAPPQYQVFRRLPRSVLFTFNLDGLARYHLDKSHHILEPHGTVDRFWTDSSKFEEYLEWSLDIPLPSVSQKILPGPEPYSITNASAYREAASILRDAPAVIVLGYSFGTFAGRFDDAESFAYFIDCQQHSPSPIFVVSPDPEPLSASIEEALKSRRVIPVTLYWDVFSRVVEAALSPGREFSDLLVGHHVDPALNSYVGALEDHLSG
jgi:hypothetical protein